MPRPQLCAVIPAHNESSSIENVLHQLYRAKVGRCIVIANGCTDESAAIAKRTGARLFQHVEVVSFEDALGPDVARAIGAYAGLRTFPDTTHYLFVDGDWQGSFGPDLDKFIRFRERTSPDVLFVGHSPRSSGLDESPEQVRPDNRWWRTVLTRTFPDLVDVAPAELPMLVRTRTFRHVSPYYLHHPGLWLALCLRVMTRGVSVDLYNDWNTHLLGNPTRSREHAERMATTLFGDALEGGCVLLGLKPTRMWRGVYIDGYHTTRRLDILRGWQSSSTRGKGQMRV